MTQAETQAEGNNKEIVERDKLICDYISYRYNLEWDRFKILDGKASGVISFVGIILALQGGIGAILIKDVPKTGTLFTLMNGIFILSILCLTLSIICGLKAYYIQTWTMVPKPHHLIEEYGKKNRSRTDIFRIMGQGLSESIDNNKDNNNKKASFIIYGFILLVIGLVLNLFFIVGVIILVSY